MRWLLLLLLMALYPTLSASIATAFADAGTHEVEGPAGIYYYNGGLTRATPDFTFYGGPTVLINQSRTGTVDVVIGSPILNQFGPTGAEIQCTGDVVPATDELTLEEDLSTPLVPGEKVLLKIGVLTGGDPAEPQFEFRRIVESFTGDGATAGDVVTFTQALGVTATFYADVAALQAATDPSQWSKIGAWQYMGSTYKRGLGHDTGMMRYITFTDNVHIKNLGFVHPRTHAQYGYQHIAFYSADDCSASGISIVNPTGVALFTTACERCGFDGVNITGIGDANNFDNPASHAVPYVIGNWGGLDCYAQNLHIDGKSIALYGSERATTRYRTSNVYLKTRPWVGTTLANSSHFGVFGPGAGTRFEDLEIDGPAQSSSMISASLQAGTTLKGHKWTNSAILDYLPVVLFDWEATKGVAFEIGGYKFGPAVAFTGADPGCTFNLTGTSIACAWPAGIYLACSITLSNHANITAVDAGTNGANIHADPNSVCDTAQGVGQIRMESVTIAAFLAVMRHRIFCSVSMAGRTSSISGTYLPLISSP